MTRSWGIKREKKGEGGRRKREIWPNEKKRSLEEEKRGERMCGGRVHPSTETHSLRLSIQGVQRFFEDMEMTKISARKRRKREEIGDKNRMNRITLHPHLSAALFSFLHSLF